MTVGKWPALPPFKQLIGYDMAILNEKLIYALKQSSCSLKNVESWQ